MFLKSLPENSYFNVVSFGNASEQMFGKSQMYNEIKLKEAIKKINPMTANMGGTSILAPLANLLKSKVI